MCPGIWAENKDLFRRTAHVKTNTSIHRYSGCACRLLPRSRGRTSAVCPALRRILANQLHGTWRSNRRICRAHDKYAAWNLLPCGCAGDFLRRIPAGGTCKEHLPCQKQAASCSALLHNDCFFTARPALLEHLVRLFRRRGYERHRLSLPRVGGKVPFRCVAPCKWAGILEADTACLPAIFFRAMNL